MDSERIARIITDIERFLSDFKSLGIKSEEDLKDKEKFYAASMIMFSAVNRAIDLGEEVVSDKKLGAPETYRDIFYFLEMEKIIDARLRQEFSSLIHFRNLAAHEYQNFTKKDVFEAVKKLAAMKIFANAVKKLYK